MRADEICMMSTEKRALKPFNLGAPHDERHPDEVGLAAPGRAAIQNLCCWTFERDTLFLM